MLGLQEPDCSLTAAEVVDRLDRLAASRAVMLDVLAAHADGAAESDLTGVLATSTSRSWCSTATLTGAPPGRLASYRVSATTRWVSRPSVSRTRRPCARTASGVVVMPPGLSGCGAVTAGNQTGSPSCRGQTRGRRAPPRSARGLVPS
jgi:hypothetical protein